MTDETDLDEIRERKREELKRRMSGESGATRESGGASAASTGSGGADESDGDDGSDGTGGGSRDEPVSVTGEEALADLVERHDVVLVDFYADWCGPCKTMDPVVARVAAETHATVAKVDVDRNDALATEYGVRGVPTFVVFADGEPVERLVGAQDESRLRAVLER